MQNSKWRVLIVDDEFRIGQMIKKLIRWEELEMECADVVDNGVTALQIIETQRIDVVITDVRMPKINGLDLIQMSKEKNPQIRFVVVSGYKEFEYARRALQYGVDEYLLKPINEEELNKIMRKIYEYLCQKKNDMIRKNKIEETIAESKQIIRREFLNNIIEHEDQTEYNNGRVSLEAELYRGIDIKLDYINCESADKKQDTRMVEWIISTVENILKSEAEEVLICEKEYLHIYCLFNYDEGKAKIIKNSINEILSEIQDYISGFEQYEVTIGIGTERKEFGEIRFSIKEANKAVCNRIKQGVGRLIYFENIPTKEVEETSLSVYKENFVSSIESYNRRSLEQCINQIYSGYVMDEIECSSCYDVAGDLADIFFGRIESNSEETQRISQNLRNRIQHCNTVIKLKNLLKTEFGNYLDMEREALETESVRPIRKAKQFIEEHYREKIGLEDIAAVVELNPVYFSVLFKKETGLNFSSYLTNVRIEKAKEMLCTTNETVAAIADSVGYKDARYFSQTFTKIVGVKPVLYRKLHS